MSVTLLTPDALARDLAVRDLTDPTQGRHAVQSMVDDVVVALRAAWRCEVRTVRGHPVVPIEDNYGYLGYPEDSVNRDARYTRYVSETCVLRSSTSALVPRALRTVGAGSDVLLACPGICYRRDAVDKLHTGTPHQLDLWRVSDTTGLGEADLVAMIGTVLTAALPGARWRTVGTGHPYTTAGRQIDVLHAGDWVEVGECGLAAPHVLAMAGLPPRRWSGLAMGLGLDRLLMVRKDIPDIRLLRSTDPRIAGQMRDLAPYRPVSHMPPISRDMSIAVGSDIGLSAEELGDRIRAALGQDADVVEHVAVLTVTPYRDVPDVARQRLGMLPGQHNVLVRVVLRALDRTLTTDEANALRDRIYAALHCGGQEGLDTASAAPG